MARRFFEGKRGESIFRYAVITDTHIQPKGGEESPWKANRHSNSRARWVIGQVNKAEPAFLVHMGDIVHPLPHSPKYGPAAETALSMLLEVRAPVQLIPGNHDVGDKNNPVMPAHVVDELGLGLFEKWFGPLYSSFDHGDVHFVLINALALNSGLAHGEKHARWLESDLEANKDRRIHILSHYPPYVLDPEEPSNYDNLDEPDRSWLLKLLRKYDVEAFFAGHVHQFLYQKYGATDIYNIPATSFVRQDYSEMFRVEAADEYGRNDVQKLGWCVVDVYEDAHIAYIRRSHGATIREDEMLHREPEVSDNPVEDGAFAPLGVHLRHPWAEETDLPYNGPLDEFTRKRVRNDYTLLGLWECGIRKLRVPLSDLLDERIRARMEALMELGHLFNVFSLGVPSETELDILRSRRNLVSQFEVVLPLDDYEDNVRDLITLQEKVAIPIFISRIASSAEREHVGSKFTHYVSCGFRMPHTQEIETFLRLGVKEAVEGFVFEVGADESPWLAIQAIGDYASRKGFRAMANVRLASENPAEYLADDIRVSNRVAEAMVSASAKANVDVFLDTFMDVDRGYFPRVGLYDRRCNRRPSSYVFANMQAALNRLGPGISLEECKKVQGGNVCSFQTDRAFVDLFLPSSSEARGKWTVPVRGRSTIVKGGGKILDLESGNITEAIWIRAEGEIEILRPTECRVPFLFIFEK